MVSKTEKLSSVSVITRLCLFGYNNCNLPRVFSMPNPLFSSSLLTKTLLLKTSSLNSLLSISIEIRMHELSSAFIPCLKAFSTNGIRINGAIYCCLHYHVQRTTTAQPRQTEAAAIQHNYEYNQVLCRVIQNRD